MIQITFSFDDYSRYNEMVDKCVMTTRRLGSQSLGKRGKKIWRRRQRRRIFWFSGGPSGSDNVGGPGIQGGLGGQDSLGD